MHASIRGVSEHQRELLASGWEFCPVPADEITTPAALSAAALPWRSTRVPNTAAGSLRDLGEWDLSAPPRRFDAEDWWYRCRFAAPAGSARCVLGFDGLATVADVWLNGEALFSSDNMFRVYEFAPTLAPQNELLLRFRSLDKLLTARRPRPRWRAPMIENQQLRWFRATPLGRTPGWSPPAAAVGPWGDIWLERRQGVELEDLGVRSSLQGDDGLIELEARILPLAGCRLESARLVAGRNGQEFCADLVLGADSRAHAQLRVPRADRWWPHTHGAPSTYSLRLDLELGEAGKSRSASVQLSPVGFRQVEARQDDGGFEIRINGAPVFCRGACWTPPDIATLRASREALGDLLTQVRDAGMNMLRVGGTMVYESRDFLELCDELGILVWQDLMFANMDYPEDDAAFVANVQAELRQQLGRLLPHPCVAVICGNSEVEQQAAMWGAPRERWQPRLFHEIIPALLQGLRSDVPWWPSSAHGGAFPHQVNSGTTSYYGVGAYLRPLEDARRSGLRFATESLGFANIPEDQALAAMPRGLALRVHHPEWKLRAPRDLGAGWDFDDVRDFYLRELFGVDPLKLRYADHDQYLRLSRLVTGEVMAAAFSEWRRARSSCRGALVWFLRDLWPGAGWGLIDALGEPKAALHLLGRALQPVSVAISDEGNSGLDLHVYNEAARPLAATLRFTMYRQGEVVIAQGQRPVSLAAQGMLELPAAELLTGFHDLTYAYRFGPPSYDVAVASLHLADAAPFAFATYFPSGRAVPSTQDIGLTAEARPVAGGFALTLKTRAFARWVQVEAEGFRCEDQYFHLLPGSERVLMLRPVSPSTAGALRGRVLALNATAAVNLNA
jgi:beta-mannosidase